MLMFGSLMPGKMASGKISENLINRFRKDSKELILGPKMTGVKKKKEKKRKEKQESLNLLLKLVKIQ